MTISYPLKRNSWQQLAKPMLLFSIGIHGLLLLLPLPKQETEVIKKAVTQDKVKITELPSSSLPSVSKKTIQPTVKPSPVTKQKAAISTAVKQSQKVVASTKTAKTTPQTIASKPLETSSLSNPSSLNNPFGDFPKYINAQPGSLGLFAAPIDRSSQQTKDSITAVTQYFERELKAREYKINFAKNEASTKVIEVTKGNTTKFLNLITHDSATVIVLASEILNPENIDDVATVSPQEEAFINILDGTNLENIEDPELYLADPSLFYSKFGADKDGFYEVEQKSNTVGTIRLIADRIPEQVFDTVFAQALKSSGFEVNPQGEYGGGIVYEVKQEGFVTYLNLVPTSDRQGTIVVSWSSMPN